MNRMLSILLTTCLVLGTVLVTYTCASAQSCKASADLAGCPLGKILASRSPMGDGFIHVTYSFTNGLNGSTYPAASFYVTQAFGAAFQNWNQYSATTGIKFDHAGPTNVSDIQVYPDSNTDITHGCAAEVNESGNFVYDPSGYPLTGQMDPALGQGVAAHEIGHWMGLDEGGQNPPGATIMNNGIAGITPCGGDPPTMTVQPGDAAVAANCGQNAKADTLQDITSLQTYDYQPYDGGCWATVLITDYYLCTNGECEYWGSDLEVLSVNCNLL